MRAMPVEVILELDQLVFEIYGRPEQYAVQILASNSADLPQMDETVEHRALF